MKGAFIFEHPKDNQLTICEKQNPDLHVIQQDSCSKRREYMYYGSGLNCGVLYTFWAWLLSSQVMKHLKANNQAQRAMRLYMAICNTLFLEMTYCHVLADEYALSSTED